MICGGEEQQQVTGRAMSLGTTTQRPSGLDAQQQQGQRSQRRRMRKKGRLCSEGIQIVEPRAGWTENARASMVEDVAGPGLAEQLAAFAPPTRGALAVLGDPLLSHSATRPCTCLSLSPSCSSADQREAGKIAARTPPPPRYTAS